MNAREVVLSPEARDDLIAMYDRIAEAASPVVALGYAERIESFLRGFDLASERGTLRKAADETFTMHRLMRELLQEREKKDRPIVHCEIHTHLFETLRAQIPKEAGRITSAHDELFWQCKQHLTASEGDVNWIETTIAIFQDAARYRLLRDHWTGEYLQHVQSFGPEHPDTLSTLAHLARMKAHLGEFEEALSELNHVRAALTKDSIMGIRACCR